MIVVQLFLAVPWVCLKFVFVVFPDHTHLLFLIKHFTLLLLFYMPCTCTSMAKAHFCSNKKRMDAALDLGCLYTRKGPFNFLLAALSPQAFVSE